MGLHRNQDSFIPAARAPVDADRARPRQLDTDNPLSLNDDSQCNRAAGERSSGCLSASVPLVAGFAMGKPWAPLPSLARGPIGALGVAATALVSRLEGDTNVLPALV